MGQNIIQSIFIYVSRINFLSVLIVFLFIFYAVYVFLISYHLNRFGIGVKPKIVSFIFIWGSLILLIGVAYAFYQVDFSEVFDFWPQFDLFKISLPK